MFFLNVYEKRILLRWLKYSHNWTIFKILDKSTTNDVLSLFKEYYPETIKEKKIKKWSKKVEVKNKYKKRKSKRKHK